MKRRAIIFGNAGVEGSVISKKLNGVAGDLKKMYEFLRSDNGGAWRKDEMICFEPNEINKSELLDTIKEERKIEEVDYWIIVFSGHGWADKYGIDYLEVIPEELDTDSDCALFEIVDAVGADAKLLLITDSCRALVSLNESENGKIKTKYFSDTEYIDTPYRRECRRIYNSFVNIAPNASLFIAQSCDFKESSYDNDKYGGEYINALIECANGYMNTEQFLRNHTPSHISTLRFSLSKIHSCAKDKVAVRTLHKQNPKLSSPRSGDLPFCVMP